MAAAILYYFAFFNSANANSLVCDFINYQTAFDTSYLAKGHRQVIFTETRTIEDTIDGMPDVKPMKVVWTHNGGAGVRTHSSGDFTFGSGIPCVMIYDETNEVKNLKKYLEIIK